MHIHVTIIDRLALAFEQKLAGVAYKDAQFGRHLEANCGQISVTAKPFGSNVYFNFNVFIRYKCIY